MSDTQIIYLLGFVGSLIPIFTIVVKLNGTLTKLNITIENLSKEMDISTEDRKVMHKTLNNHETRITVLEKKEERK